MNDESEFLDNCLKVIIYGYGFGMISLVTYAAIIHVKWLGLI